MKISKPQKFFKKNPKMNYNQKMDFDPKMDFDLKWISIQK